MNNHRDTVHGSDPGRDPGRDTDLVAVLDRATDRIGPADSAQHDAVAALARARVLRHRRRGAAVAAVAAAAVLAVVLVTGGGLHRADTPVAPSPKVPQTTSEVVQDVWDPRTAGDLATGSTALPADLTPPAHVSPLPLDGPARAVLDSVHGHTLHLLGADGSWAAASSPVRSVNSAALSPDGTMLAVLGDGSVWVTDVRDGKWRELDLPAADGPVEIWAGIGARPVWAGDDRLLIEAPGGGVATLAVDGSAKPTSSYHGTAMVSGLTVAPDGTELLFGTGRHSRVIRELRSDSVTRTLDAAALERVSMPVASADGVVGTVSGIPGEDRPSDHAGLVALDRGADYATRAYLPIARTHYEPGLGIAELGAGGVRPLAWIDDHTVLLQTRSTTYGAPWALVTWDVDSGDLALVSQGGGKIHLAGVAAVLVAPGS